MKHHRRTWVLVAIAAWAATSPEGVRAQGAAPPAAVGATRSPPRYLTAAQRADIDAYVERAMKDWGDVPGLSVSVVQGDSVVYTKGYGVREQGRPEGVNERTLFAIGSNTKSMTAALVGTLVDEGKMRWDEPVWTYLPSFRLADAYASREVTMRDLLSHRVGVENNLSAWYRSAFTRAQLVQRTRYLRQAASFRSVFLYNNLMYTTAGEAAATAAGTTWNALLRERLFAPLGMTASLTNSRELPAQGNVATPHMPFNGALVPIAHVDGDNIGPAGSVYSNAVDMAQYLRMQIGNGTYKGRRVLTAQSVAALRTLTNPIGPWQATVADSDNVTHGYGLGWLIESYRGHRRVRHNGSIDGYLAEMQVLPDDKVGVVVLTNQMTRQIPEAVANHVLDVALGLRPRDWLGESRTRARAQEAAAAARAPQRPAPSAPTLSLEKYAGTYSDSLRGVITVVQDSGRLVLSYHPGLVAVLEPWQYNTFRLAWRSPNIYANNQLLLTFDVDAAGRVAGLANTLLGTFRAAPAPPARAAGTPPGRNR